MRRNELRGLRAVWEITALQLQEAEAEAEEDVLAPEDVADEHRRHL